MTTTTSDTDLLTDWAVREHKHRPRLLASPRAEGIRFVLYGRMSTKDHQDPIASLRWQRYCADDLVGEHGQIVQVFFDAGVSRRIPWALRPQASALLAAIADPDRDFDAIVLGEFERGFYGHQLRDLLPLLEQHGVQLWLPEIGGPVDPDNPQQMALLDALGVDSRREITRARYRTTVGMLLLVDDGRHLGGRPPYGYQLAPAEPHPNRVHARHGRRIYRLHPDPVTAPHVQWMFQQRLEGHSPREIADGLNERGVPCPSAADPERNPGRHCNKWSTRTVASILANPRYTGRQVWNRQPSHHPTNANKVRSWSTPAGWAISHSATHEALVSEQDYVRVQQIRALPRPADGSHRRYLLAGLVYCGACRRPMESHWANGRPGYRCRHGNRRIRYRKTLYIREDQLLQRLRALACKLRLPNPTDPKSLAGHLRDCGITISCRPESWEVKTRTWIKTLRPPNYQPPLIPPAPIRPHPQTSTPATRPQPAKQAPGKPRPPTYRP